MLTEVPGAVPADGYAGLFHFALLVPERIDLARWLLHSARSELELTGMSDHFVSEAIYLRDPDGHGIEVYWDRPRALWEGQVAQRLTTAPLDVHDLVRGVDTAAGLAGRHGDGPRPPARRRRAGRRARSTSTSSASR